MENQNRVIGYMEKVKLKNPDITDQHELLNLAMEADKSNMRRVGRNFIIASASVFTGLIAFGIISLFANMLFNVIHLLLLMFSLSVTFLILGTTRINNSDKSAKQIYHPYINNPGLLNTLSREQSNYIATYNFEEPAEYSRENANGKKSLTIERILKSGRRKFKRQGPEFKIILLRVSDKKQIPTPPNNTSYFLYFFNPENLFTYRYNAHLKEYNNSQIGSYSYLVISSQGELVDVYAKDEWVLHPELIPHYKVIKPPVISNQTPDFSQN